MVIATDNDDYVTIYPDNCSCSVEYAIEAPLAFGEDLYLRYELAINGLDGTLNGINQDVDPKSGLYLDVLEIAGEIVSTIPASFEISAEPIDADGNVISGIALTVKGDGQIKGGSIDNPVTSELVIYLSIDETSNVAALDGLNLILTGSSNSEIAGVCLNENQGLKINDISAHVVGSYVLSFEE